MPDTLVDTSLRRISWKISPPPRSCLQVCSLYSYRNYKPAIPLENEDLRKEYIYYSVSHSLGRQKSSDTDKYEIGLVWVSDGPNTLNCNLPKCRFIHSSSVSYAEYSVNYRPPIPLQRLKGRDPRVSEPVPSSPFSSLFEEIHFE